MYSLIIPVYKNEGSIPELLQTVTALNASLDHELEVVFVVDGSPDQSYALLSQALPTADFSAKLIALSRNFGSFAAIRMGLQAATGKYFAVMAADLQEPSSLILDFFTSLKNEEIDVVIGTRNKRNDPLASRLAAQTFWYLYRKCVVKDMPVGGVDIFGCNTVFRDHLLQLEESHSSLVALLFWLGFRRKQIAYQRLQRQHGKSAWTFRKKLNYLMDSIFAFTDLPIKLLIAIGGLGLGISFLLGFIIVIARVTEWISIPGYAATMLSIMFFGTLNVLGLGIVGSYAWRAYENTKQRPLAISMHSNEYNKK